jgi:protein phosphatase
MFVMPKIVTIPEMALVVLVGPSGCGKSTFARQQFLPTEILSSDQFRAMISDNESDQTVSGAAFELLYTVAAKRLALSKLTVVDATNVTPEARKQSLELARRFHTPAIALVFDYPEELCLERNALRTHRQVPRKAIKGHIDALHRSGRRMRDEGFASIFYLSPTEETTIVRERLPVNRRDETGPFDIIGDVHGCLDELKELFLKLGYTLGEAADPDGGTSVTVTPPEGRKVIFVGDLVDRGPDSPGVMRLVMRMVEAGTALCVRGNHDDKLARKLQGRNVSISHGLGETLAQLDREPPLLLDRVRPFLDNLPTHYVLDGGKLVVAHAGLEEKLQGKMSERVRSFCLYGETTGESDEFGLPVRLNWGANYRGPATVVYGHTPTSRPEWLNKTICIDTGCVFGGELTALRYPGSEMVSVPAHRMYAEPKRPLAPPEPAPIPAQVKADDILDFVDVNGKRVLSTRLIEKIPVRAENAAAALEVMSRFAANPRWLIYLPPTMSPSESAKEPGYLEYPREAFQYYAQEGVAEVICEQKHMGSRAVVIICREEEVAKRRFGIEGEGFGICYTRTGRRFFDKEAKEREFLEVIRQAIDRAGWWEKFQSDWFCFDGELMPWSAKAQELLQKQYAATGSAARAALHEVLQTLPEAASGDLQKLREEISQRAEMVDHFVTAYRHYCWPVQSLADLRYAPFHLLASEGKVHVDQDHGWHMTTLAELVAPGQTLLMATPYRKLNPADDQAVQEACRWWEELTSSGGEGMVVKPLQWLQKGRRSYVQPAMKVRGREYLRIIYGPEYLRPEHLSRLAERRVGMKQSLALREFALGLEAMERFIRHEPLRQVHECVFGLLALESEPIDSRL